MDVFSRQVEKNDSTTVSHVMVLKYSEAQRGLIKKFHEWLFAPWHCLRNIVDGKLGLRHDIRGYVMSCATCQEMDTRHKVIWASGFVLSALKPMKRIAMDTIGPVVISIQFILVIIDVYSVRRALPD